MQVLHGTEPAAAYLVMLMTVLLSLAAPYFTCCVAWGLHQVWWHQAGSDGAAAGQLMVAHLGTERPTSAIPVASPVTCLETWVSLPHLTCHQPADLGPCQARPTRSTEWDAPMP